MRTRLATLAAGSLLTLVVACSPSTSKPVAGSGGAIAPGLTDARVLELMSSVQVPGAQIATVKGDRVTENVYGFANATTGERVEADTIFEAASISKPVFAYAVLRLVADGKFDLDRPLDSYLPAPYVADPRSSRVTARMVLTHRSGLPNWRPRGQPLAFEADPGARFGYSGEGIVWLQHAIEALTKEDFDVTMRRLVFEPLGMTHSSYIWRQSVTPKKAWGHDDAGTRDETRRDRETPIAAASLHTTAGDLGRFLAAIFERKGLSDAATLEMLRPQSDPFEGCAVCAGKAKPGEPSRLVAWGLGWGLVRGNRRAFWHWGDNGSFKAYIFGDDSTHRGVVVLTNGNSGLAIAGDLAALAVAGDAGSAAAAPVPLVWLSYDRPDAPMKAALHQVVAGAGHGSLDALLAHKDLDEESLNSLGYALLRSGHVQEALSTLQTNASLQPDSWNAWDSLGEALVKAGKRDEALAAYRRSVALNPKNESGVKKINELETLEKN